MNHKWLPKEQRKTILLLSDDIRIPSGIGTMSREIVEGTCHRYNWVQLGAAINHPDFGKILDLSEDFSNRTGVKDASVLVYPNNGYGDHLTVRRLIQKHNPNALLHFTDPRYWTWLYNMEHEIRQNIPILYYNIWDDTPAPFYNRHFYRSCDGLFSISKQTYNINKQVLGDNIVLKNRSFSDKLIHNVLKNYKNKEWSKAHFPVDPPKKNLNDSTSYLAYIPHGINPNKFFKITPESTEWIKFNEFKKNAFNGKNYEFVVFYNSRNIRRKSTSDILLAFNHFRNQLPDDKKDGVLLLMHTQPIDDNGTNLLAVHKDVVPNINIIFTDQRLEQEGVNALYNMSDITINISSAEGFGLSIAESLMSETPVIVNVTGGLQDQCGFKDDNGNYLDPDIHYNREWGSNHDGKYTEHGEWVIPVFPKAISLVGSPITPYIFDDRCDWVDVGNAIFEWWKRGKEERERCGKLGRDFCLDNNKGGLNAENMCNLFIESINDVVKNFKPRKKFVLEKI